MGRIRDESFRYFSKHVGVVEISSVADVTSKVEGEGDVYSNGGIYVSCPELGFEGDNLIYCRYALSIPYYKVKDGDRVWIEPTIGHTERWIYSGFVDCGRASVDPTAETDTQGIIENEDGIYIFRMGEDISIELDSTAKLATLTVGAVSIILDGADTTGAITISSNSNTIVLADTAPAKVSINGTNLEVLA